MGLLWSSELLEMQAKIQELAAKIEISQFYIDSFCSRELPEKAREFIKDRIQLMKVQKNSIKDEYTKLQKQAHRNH
jgi:hypothetical protein